MSTKMDFNEAVRGKFIPPHGMGRQQRGMTVRSVTVWKYEQGASEPTLHWVSDFRNNGEDHAVYVCDSAEEAQKVYMDVLSRGGVA
jgi:hypothetical protein